MPTLEELDPAAAAEVLLDAHRDEPGWLDAFSAALDRRREGAELARALQVWGLSRAEAGPLFGVTRQALTKWLRHGVPADRAGQAADLVRATDLLVRYLRRDRIAAVVRRPAKALDGRSLLDLLADGDTDRLLEATRSMFDFGRVQA